MPFAPPNGQAKKDKAAAPPAASGVHLGRLLPATGAARRRWRSRRLASVGIILFLLVLGLLGLTNGPWRDARTRALGWWIRWTTSSRAAGPANLRGLVVKNLDYVTRGTEVRLRGCAVGHVQAWTYSKTDDQFQLVIQWQEQQAGQDWDTREWNVTEARLETVPQLIGQVTIQLTATRGGNRPTTPPVVITVQPEQSVKEMLAAQVAENLTPLRAQLSTLIGTLNETIAQVEKVVRPLNEPSAVPTAAGGEQTRMAALVSQLSGTIDQFGKVAQGFGKVAQALSSSRTQGANAAPQETDLAQTMHNFNEASNQLRERLSESRETLRRLNQLELTLQGVGTSATLALDDVQATSREIRTRGVRWFLSGAPNNTPAAAATPTPSPSAPARRRRVSPARSGSR